MRYWKYATATVSLIAVFAVWFCLETSGLINVVSVSPPYTLIQFAQIVGAVGSVILSLALVLLYRKQTRVQENQEKLMEAEYRPILRAGLDVRYNIPLLVIQNTGRAAAHDVKVEWFIAGQDRAWSTPFVPSGGKHEFSLFEEEQDEDEEDDEETEVGLSEKEVLNILSRSEGSGILKCEMSCKDMIGKSQNTSEAIDVAEAIESLYQTADLAERDPLSDMSRELSRIRREMRRLR